MVTARHRGKKKVVLRMVIRKASALAKNVFHSEISYADCKSIDFTVHFLGGRMQNPDFLKYRVLPGHLKERLKMA